MPNDDRAFLIRGDDGQEYGPVDLGELRGWVQENRVGIGTDVRLDTPGERWQSWHDYPELVALLAEVQGTGSVASTPALVIAPVHRRVLAWIIDWLLIMVLLIPLGNIAAVLLPMDTIQTVITEAAFNPSAIQDVPPKTLHQVAMFEMSFFVVLALYFTGFVAAHGRTPGKSVMRIAIVDESGAKPSLARALVRSVILILSMNFFFLPFLSIFFHPQRRGLHDLFAGTYVVEAA